MAELVVKEKKPVLKRAPSSLRIKAICPLSKYLLVNAILTSLCQVIDIPDMIISIRFSNRAGI